jgi:hypothetical protein
MQALTQRDTKTGQVNLPDPDFYLSQNAVTPNIQNHCLLNEY